MNHALKQSLINLGRFLGVLVGLFYLLFAFFSTVFPAQPKPNRFAQFIEGLPILLILLTISFCLLAPYRLIKSAKKSLFFFRIFLIVGMMLILFSPKPLEVSSVVVSLVIIGNIYISYLHYKEKMNLKS